MVIIVGAGAAGLMAAHDLLSKGHPVTILEARGRLGGRIHTLLDPITQKMEEAGAEFVHGNLPLTTSLLQAAGLTLAPSGGKIFRSQGGVWEESYTPVKGWQDLLDRMGDPGDDMTVSVFLETYYSGEENTDLRASMRRFAEGFDLADIDLASTHALYKEWSKENQAQYRVAGGYQGLIDHLARLVTEQGGKIYKNIVVKEIRWRKGQVDLRSSEGQSFIGKAAVITVPLGVLKAAPDHPAAIAFSPALPSLSVVPDMGYGSVIKLLLRFEEPFWQTQTPGLGFLLSDQPLPTWWTQSSPGDALLTGWWNATAARAFQQATPEEMIAVGLRSLSVIFHQDPDQLRAQLLHARVYDWAKDPFSAGAYSFPAMGDVEARKRLNTPTDDTLFFGGEALYEGDETPGTVEAALASGAAVALLVSDAFHRR